MVDEESHETVSEPGEAPPSDGDERPDGEMTEGDAAGEEAEAVAPKSEAEKAARTPPPAGAPPERPFSMPRSEPKPPGSGGALLAGAFAGAAVSVLAAVGGFALLQPTAGLSEADASRLAALEFGDESRRRGDRRTRQASRGGRRRTRRLRARRG